MKAQFLLFICLAVSAIACSDDTSPGTTSSPDAELESSPDLGVTRVDFGGGLDAAPDQSTPDMDLIEAGWTTLAPMPQGPRQETAVVASGDEVYVIGGFNRRVQIVPTVEVYDPRAGTWRRAADVPAPLHHANVAVLDGKIWVVGFLVGGFAPDGRIFVYDPTTDVWTPEGEMPAAEVRGASAVGVIGGRIYLAGGLQDGAVRRVSSYEPTTGEWLQHADMPRDMDHGAFGVVDGKLIVAGGRDSSIGAHVPDVDLYDPSSNSWSSGAPMPTSRGGVAAAVVSGRLFVLGGEGAANVGGVFDAVEAYDLSTNTWEVFDAMETPRHGMGAAAVGEVIYVPGGATVQAFGAVDHHDALRP